MFRCHLKIRMLFLSVAMLCGMAGTLLAQRRSPFNGRGSNAASTAHWSNKRNARQPATATSSGELVAKISPDKFNQHYERSRLKLTDGTSLEVDDAWIDAQGVWYKRGGVTNLVERERVRSVERIQLSTPSDAAATRDTAIARVVDVNQAQTNEAVQPVWIYLVGGARVEADEVTETANGAWYRRGTLSIFLARERIERIEREPLKPATGTTVARRERGWTTGNGRIDELIRVNGTQHGVDPYLIFCVMEQESHFNAHALSPKGAGGLMQLMPGTAARFGVRRPFDPAQNIMGGARYLKDLLQQFNGRVDLVLASYNAGEGAVIKYGHTVPPYRETRDYVKRISARYAQNTHSVETLKATAALARPSRLK